MRNFVLAFALGFGVSGAANAADVNVAPGLGTLNAAIVAAADGDTLFLQDGTYRMLGTTIAKNLTIKAQTNNAPVIVPDTNTGTNRAIRLGNATAEISVSFVGVHLSAIDISVVPGDDVDLTVVESTWSGYPNSITDSSDLLDDLVLIGNTFTSSHWNFDANKLIIAGNTFNLPSQTTFGHINVTSRHTSHFVGNEVNSAHHYRTGMLTLFGESHFVLANRFRTDLSVGDVGTSTQDQQYTVISTSGEVYAAIKNNIIEVTLPASFAPDPLDPLTSNVGIGNFRPINIAANAIGAIIENNTMDFGMDGDDIVFKAESPVIYASSAVIARNNIVANTSRPMIGFSQPDFEVGSTVEYNLCDNPVADLCGGDNIVDGDPLFTDTVNYVPAAGSAAIDAGDPLGIFNDVDGSRNNLGAYGGTFAVDQYDVQRAGGRVEPYLYPLFEPNKSVSSTGKLNVRVIGLARSK